MADGFIGEVTILPYTFAPRGWTPCDGQLLPISQNSIVFAVIGGIYGGDSRVTFGVPDLTNRVPMGAGTGPGLSPKFLGYFGGQDTVALSMNEYPAHNHNIINVHYDPAETSTPQNSYIGRMGGNKFYKAKSDNISTYVQMNPSSLATAGLSVAHENRQPFLAMQFCLCIDGTFPSRN